METPANLHAKREGYESSVWEELLGHKVVSSEGRPGGELQGLSQEQQTETIPVVGILTPTTKAWDQISLSALSPKASIWPEPQSQSLFGQQKWTAEKAYRAEGSEVDASPAIHTEIADLATHIRQWRERLLSSSKEPDPASLPDTNENHVEEDAFPNWLT